MVSPYSNMHFPNDICGASFHMLICHLYILFGEVSVKVFGSCLIGLFVFLLLNFKSSLCILDNGTLSDVSFANMFFSSVVYLVILLILHFTEQKILIKSSLPFFFFHGWCLWCCI